MGTGTAKPASWKRYGKGRRLPPEVLSDDEVRRLLDAVTGYGANTLRNRALIAVLYRSGLRISEALSLAPKDLDLNKGMVRVLFGKGGKSRTVGIDPGGAEMLCPWLTARERLGFGPGEPLFCTRSGSPLGQGYTRRMFQQLRERAGIAKRVHAHGLRHTLAAQLREEGLDVGVISKQLGHQSIAVTARYIDHLMPLAAVRAVGGRNWRPLHGRS